ncbi:unnamed protein product [Heterobilharzia americana]|nr:unnamed protein product [Heterobilharzia americana]
MSERVTRPSPLLIPPSNKGYQLLTRIGWSDSAVDVNSNHLSAFETPSADTSSASKSHYIAEGSGLGAHRQGRRFPVATILKRDRLGFGWPNSTNTAKITHFNSGDIKAVENPADVKHHRLSIKLDSKYLVRRINREKKIERIIRQEFNLTEDQLAILRGK